MSNNSYAHQNTTSSQPVVAYCDLVKNPEKYGGKEVSVYATYKYGIEIQQLLCLECSETDKTWLAEDHLDQKIRKKMPKDAAIINGVFIGTFQSSGGPFGDGG